MRVRVLRCHKQEFIGKIVDTYFTFANGVNFVTKYGMIFLESGDYELVDMD